MFIHGDWELISIPYSSRAYAFKHLRIINLELVVYTIQDKFVTNFDWATDDERIYINNALDKFVRGMKRASFTALLKGTDEKILS